MTDSVCHAQLNFQCVMLDDYLFKLKKKTMEERIAIAKENLLYQEKERLLQEKKTSKIIARKRKQERLLQENNNNKKKIQ